MNLYLRLLLRQIRKNSGPRLSAWDTAVTQFRVTPTDLDVLMHMNNGKYLTIMDLGRVDLMERSGLWSKIRDKGWFPVVAGQMITYRKSLKLGQKFDLHTRIIGFDDRWGYVEQTFKVGEVVYAHAIVRARFLKKSGGSVEHDELEAVVGSELFSHEVPQWITDWTAASKLTR